MDPIPSSPSLSPMMGPGIRLEDTFTVDYDSPEEIDASMYQVSWTNVMAEGRYRSPSVYKKVEVLMLCWQENNCAMKTKGEVERLRSVFQDGFGYRVSISYLNAKGEQSLQLQVNAEVAVFARKHDGRDTLLIVYYAGHGKPGEFFGDLELFGSVTPCSSTGNLLKFLACRQISPNDPRDEKRRLRNRVVWNKTEDILRPVVADVLEIFDW